MLVVDKLWGWKHNVEAEGLGVPSTIYMLYWVRVKDR